MLEKVAEWRETKSFSCSSRLQEARSMSQERIPAGGGTHLSAQPLGGLLTPPPNPKPTPIIPFPPHRDPGGTHTGGTPRSRAAPPSPLPKFYPPLNFLGVTPLPCGPHEHAPGDGDSVGVPVLGSPFWCRGSANPNLVPWGYGGASPAPLQRH